MVVDRTPLARPPAQHQTFEVFALVDEIPRVSFVGEMNVRSNLAGLRLQVRDETAQIRQFHLLRRLFELVNCRDKIHYLLT